MSGKITIDKSVIASYDGYVVNDNNFLSSVPNGSIILSRDSNNTFVVVKNNNDIKLLPNISLDYVPNKVTTIDENGNLKQINLSYDENNETISTKNIDAFTANFGDITVNNINVTDGYIAVLNSDNSTLNKLTVSDGYVAVLNSSSSNINTLNSSNIISENISSQNLNASYANLNNITSTNIGCNNGNITNIVSSNANINNITSQYIESNLISIKSDEGNFNLVYNGSIGQTYNLPSNQGSRNDFLLLDDGNSFSFANFQSSVFNTLNNNVYYVNATTLITTTSTTYVQLINISDLKPGERYLLLFNCSPYHSLNNIYSYFIVNNNGVNIPSTEAITRLSANQISSVSINTVIQANGTSIGIYWRTSSGTLSCLGRTLILLRIG